MEGKTNRLNAWYTEYRNGGRPGWSKEYSTKKKRFDHVLAKPASPQKGRFLEIGCGAGNLTIYAAEKGFAAYGIDCSSEAIAWAKENVCQSGVVADIREGNVTDLDQEYPADFFDMAYDGDCLFMVLRPDRFKCLSNIFHILRPGGYLRARAHIARSEVSERLHFKPDRYYDPTTKSVVVDDVPVYQYSLRAEFVNEIEKVGFRVINEEVYTPHPDEHPVLAAMMWVDALKPPTQGMNVSR